MCVQVEGTLCGFDPFMNLVLSDAIEFPKAGGQNKIGRFLIIIIKIMTCIFTCFFFFRNDCCEREQRGDAGGQGQNLKTIMRFSVHFTNVSCASFMFCVL